MIRFESGTKIVISDNLGLDVAGIVTDERAADAVIILDSNIADNKIVLSMVDAVRGRCRVHIVTIVPFEPTTDIVNEWADKLRGRKADIYIGIGGGSTLDLTKTLSVMSVNGGKVEDYHGTGKSFTAGVKKILIPTTAGTGSEVTGGAVLVNRKTKFKRAISGYFVVPDYAILNAALTVTMPDSVSAFTGMDALAHAVESYTTRCGNEITRMYAKEAFSLVFNNLPKVFNDRHDIAARQKVLLGSCLAGCAIYNSNTGACHSMAYPLGIYCNVPHGIAVAGILPKVVRINVEKGCLRYADLYNLIDGLEPIGNRAAAARAFSDLLEKYSVLSHIDKDLRYYGIDGDNYPFLAERGMDLKGALTNNPVEFNLDDVRRVLRELVGKEGPVRITAK